MEIKRIVKHLKEIAEPQFHPELTQLKHVDTAEMQKDDLFDEAVRIVLASKRGSVSLLQRRLSVGYARASRIIEMMAAAGILGEYKGSQAREVLMTIDEYEDVCAQMEADAEAGYADMTEESESPVTEESEDSIAEEPEDTLEDAEEEEYEEDEDEEEDADEDEDEEYEYEYVEVDEDEEEAEDEDGDEDEEESDIEDLPPVSFASEGQREYMAMDSEEQ
jgi:S-DNA-T family DNA segregation ATPase FtsK/SpoIIIE